MIVPEGMTELSMMKARPLVTRPDGKGSRGVVVAMNANEVQVYWGTSDWGAHVSTEKRDGLKIVGQEHELTVKARVAVINAEIAKTRLVIEELDAPI